MEYQIFIHKIKIFLTRHSQILCYNRTYLSLQNSPHVSYFVSVKKIKGEKELKNVTSFAGIK